MASLIGSFIGGVGLFLLGMQLMTEGLERAQGRTLRKVLSRWTHTPLRAVGAGAAITALVQASGAVVVATLGFVNAGLLPLTGALWVVFGANLGTTVTGWLVALVGFDLDLEALAFPFIGVGMALRLLARQGRLGGLGQALAGFGLFFVGIGVLQGGFTGLARQVDLAAAAGFGFWSTLLFVGIGFALTVLMQSSSAALAVTITAAAGGLLPVSAAAAAAIGANVGTTSTAAVAVIGASANAKRLAAGHVIFNLLTGVVALLLLPWLLQSSLWLAGGNLSTGVAWFHTLFNTLGVLLMWPLTRRLSAWLDARFQGDGLPDEARPRYIEDQMLSDPPGAVQGLTRELGRLAEVARRMVVSVISAEHPNGQLTRDHLILRSLSDRIGEFVATLQQRALDPANSAALPHVLQAVGYYNTAADLAQELAEVLAQPPEHEDAAAEAAVAWFKTALLQRLDQAVLEDAREIHADINQNYQGLKARLLQRGAERGLSTRALVEHLERMSLLRRAVRQLIKGHKQVRALERKSATRVDLQRTGPLLEEDGDDTWATGAHPRPPPEP